MIRLYDTLKFGYLINKTVDLSGKTMSLDTAKDVLRHLGTNGAGQTISFSNDTWGYIAADEEAIELLEAAYANGWSSNEPDIQIVAASGYNGVVRVNAANKQLTQVGSTGVWLGSAGTVTALDYFLKHDSRTNYNSTSVNVKKVRFGKNINTSSNTTLDRAFNCNNSSATNLATIDLRHLNTSNVTNMYAAFGDIMSDGTTDLLGIEDLDVSKVTNFNYCFNSQQLRSDLDLHKWRVRSNATINIMFGTLVEQASSGKQTKYYYTPGYWAKDPMNDSNLAANVVHPTVYPYHHITVAGNSSYTGKLRIDNTDTQLTKDNSLNIWYYDVPSGYEITNLYGIGNASVLADQANIVSLNIRKDTPITTEPVRLNVAFRNCTNCRTVEFGAKINVNDIQQLFNMGNNIGSLCSIYGLENLTLTTNDQGNYWFRNCANLAYVKMPENMEAWSYTSSAFSGCTKLVRITNYPAQLTTVIQDTPPLYNCTSLTTIEACGAQYKTLDLSASPLNLASAKVILNALQTVTSETLTFSSTTKGYINADSEALALVTAARNKGWSIAL